MVFRVDLQKDSSISRHVYFSHIDRASDGNLLNLSEHTERSHRQKFTKSLVILSTSFVNATDRYRSRGERNGAIDFVRISWVYWKWSNEVYAKDWLVIQWNTTPTQFLRINRTHRNLPVGPSLRSGGAARWKLNEKLNIFNVGNWTISLWKLNIILRKICQKLSIFFMSKICKILKFKVARRMQIL